MILLTGKTAVNKANTDRSEKKRNINRARKREE